MSFDGETFDPKLDRDRLSAQLDLVRNLMLDGEWRTLARISGTLDYPESSISARLRDLRKKKFGGYKVDRRRIEGGLHEYRVRKPNPFIDKEQK